MNVDFKKKYVLKNHSKKGLLLTSCKEQISRLSTKVEHSMEKPVKINPENSGISRKILFSKYTPKINLQKLLKSSGLQCR